MNEKLFLFGKICIPFRHLTINWESNHQTRDGAQLPVNNWDIIVCLGYNTPNGYKFEVQKIFFFDWVILKINPHKLISNATTFGKVVVFQIDP